MRFEKLIKSGKLDDSLAAIKCVTIFPVNGPSDWKLNLYKTLNFPPLRGGRSFKSYMTNRQ